MRPVLVAILLYPKLSTPAKGSSRVRRGISSETRQLGTRITIDSKPPALVIRRGKTNVVSSGASAGAVTTTTSEYSGNKPHAEE